MSRSLFGTDGVRGRAQPVPAHLLGSFDAGFGHRERQTVARAELPQDLGEPGRTSVVGHLNDPPVDPAQGAWGQVGTEILDQNTLRALHAPGIPDGFIVTEQLQAVGSLQGILAVTVQLPAKAGLNFV